MQMRTLIPFYALIAILLGFLSPANSQPLQLSGDQEISNILYQLKDYLSEKRYRDIDTTLDSIGKEKGLTPDGRRKLEVLINSLSLSSPIGLLDSWCNSDSTSFFPFTIRGKYYLNLAFQKDRNLKYSTQTGNEKETIHELLVKAQTDLDKALSLYPDDPASTSSMVLVCMLRGYPKQVMEQWFSKATSADPFWLESYEHKLRYLSPYQYGSGSGKEMLDFALKCVNDSPEGSSVYSVLFTYFNMLNSHHFLSYPLRMYGLNLPSEAHKAFHPTLARFKNDFPESDLPAILEGRYNFLQSEPGAALRLFETVLAKDPLNTEALKGLVTALLHTSQWKKAQTHTAALLQFDPDSAFPLLAQGLIETLMNGDSKKSEKLYFQAIEIEKSNYRKKLYWLDLANLMKERGNYREAIEAFSRAIDLDQRFEKAIWGRAESKFELNEIDGAIEDMLKLVDMGGKFKIAAQDAIETYQQAKSSRDSGSPSPNQGNSAGNEPAVIGKDTRTADIRQPVAPQATELLKKQSPQDLMINCESLYYRRMRAEAVDCYSNLLMVLPDHLQGESYFMLGKIAETMEYDLGKAVQYYEEAITRDLKNERYMTKLGETLYMMQAFEDAIMVFSKIIEINQMNGNAYYHRALCFEELNRLEEAIEDMQKAKLHDPSIADAERFLQQHARKEPPVPQISREEELLRLAEDNMMLQRFDTAEQQYNELLTINADNDYVQFRLGILFISRDRNHKKAIDQFDKAIALNPDNAGYFSSRANALKFIKDYKAAISDFSWLVEHNPSESKYYGDRGICLFELGNNAEAEADLRKAIELSPGNKYYLSYLGKVSVENNSTIAPTRENAGLFIAQGISHISKKDYQKARASFSKAIELDPDNSEPFYHMGKLFEEKIKDPQKALAYYSQAIDRDKSNRDYFFRRGKVYYNQKKWHEAVPDFNSALALNPEDGQILYYRGNCYRHLGEREKAVEDYMKVKKFAPSWTDSVNSHLRQMDQ